MVYAVKDTVSRSYFESCEIQVESQAHSDSKSSGNGIRRRKKVMTFDC